MRTLLLTRARPTVRHHQRAVTHHWHLRTVDHPAADDATAAEEAILTITWEPAMSWYRATLHRQTIWTESGTRQHSRDPRDVHTLATTRAGRFNAARLSELASTALLNLTHEQAAIFDAQVTYHQPELATA